MAGTKFLGAITTSSWTLIVDEGGGNQTATIADGTYYWSGDGTASDLLKKIGDAITTALTTNTVTLTISSTGVITMTSDTGNVVVDWTASAKGTTIRDIMRYTTSTTTITTSGVTASRVARYVVTSNHRAETDRPIHDGRSTIYEADDGTMYGLDLSDEFVDYNITIRFRGPHRDATEVAWYTWLQFWRDVIKPLGSLRWYPDDTVTTAYVELTNPNGYHTGVLPQPRNWSADEWEPTSYTWYTKDLVFRVQ
jgi:hypothetical protein